MFRDVLLETAASPSFEKVLKSLALSLLEDETTAIQVLDAIIEDSTVDGDNLHLPKWAPTIRAMYYNPQFLRPWSKIAVVGGVEIPDSIEVNNELQIFDDVLLMGLLQGIIKRAWETRVREQPVRVYFYNGHLHWDSGEGVQCESLHCQESVLDWIPDVVRGVTVRRW
jgi:hypothetical protein